MKRSLSVLILAVVVMFLLGLAGWGQATEADAGPHLVINEIEINPAGLDTDHEWVELFNPTDVPIDLLGWQLSYSYREEGFLALTETSLIISPGGRYVFVYPGLRLRNNEAHVFQLMDPEGNIIDETAPFKDEANDESTWQRFPDGGDPLFLDMWWFMEESRNESNS